MPGNPVFDSYGEAVGAVGVVVPSGVDLDRHEANDLVREPSRELGAPSWPPRAAG